MSKAWHTNDDGNATWIQFGPYQLHGIRADKCEGEGLAACVQITDADGNTISEQEFMGDPELWQLRFFAIVFAETWLKTLRRVLNEIRVAPGMSP